MQSIHHDDEARERTLLDLDEIARAGARKMLTEALEAEVRDYLEAARDERDEKGRALVVRNGHAREREVLLGAGAVAVKTPRVDDRRLDEDGNRKRFSSVILPPYMRRSPKVTEMLPLLYLHGLSSGDFIPALEEFFGTEAGLSASTITRLTEQWQTEREQFMNRDLSQKDYVYVWVDGIHTGVRLGSDGRLCSLVMVGARLDGTKELVALADGYRDHRKLGRVTQGPQKARHACTGVGGRRRGSWFLECTEGRISQDPVPERLGAQNLQCARFDAKERSLSGQGGHPRDHGGREQEGGRGGHQSFLR